MNALKQAIAAEQDFPLDLMEFRLEGELNNYFAGKGFPQRVTCHWANKDTLRLEMRGFVLALFTTFDECLYKCAANNLHWVLIQTAIKSMYPNAKVYE